MSGYVGDPRGIAKKIDKLYVGDGAGVARAVQKAYVGDPRGVAKLWYQLGTPLGSLAVGSVVYFAVGGVRTPWIVVDQGRPGTMYDASCDGTWLLCKDVYESKQWSKIVKNDYSLSGVGRDVCVHEVVLSPGVAGLAFNRGWAGPWHGCTAQCPYHCRPAHGNSCRGTPDFSGLPCRCTPAGCSRCTPGTVGHA